MTSVNDTPPYCYDKGRYEQYGGVSFTDVIKQINLYAVDASK
jgi:hypothetical protein